MCKKMSTPPPPKSKKYFCWLPHNLWALSDRGSCLIQGVEPHEKEGPRLGTSQKYPGWGWGWGVEIFTKPHIFRQSPAIWFFFTRSAKKCPPPNLLRPHFHFFHQVAGGWGNSYLGTSSWFKSNFKYFCSALLCHNGSLHHNTNHIMTNKIHVLQCFIKRNSVIYNGIIMM